MNTLKWRPPKPDEVLGYIYYSNNDPDSQTVLSLPWTPTNLKLLEPLLAQQYQQLLDETAINISETTFTQIQDTWFKLAYKKYKTVYVPRKAEKNIVKLVYDAWETNSKVMLEYKKGYEMYPSEEEENNGAVVSSDGLIRVVRIGKSTGPKPVLLHIVTRKTYGGAPFMFTGIKSVKKLN